ncbi:hypothetical protein PanWU01x14_279550 [Parasponia andersonii]|uniref:Uncharacterized protein n=1 Tax=Parasponia andersonii TaxID=3476 RepID=A0A2P5B1S9_PARAD|nr:hypothetical protein PanWU01x14_279550 [Parasponia andersonii]
MQAHWLLLRTPFRQPLHHHHQNPINLFLIRSSLETTKPKTEPYSRVSTGKCSSFWMVEACLLAWGLRQVPVKAWSPNGVLILFGLRSGTVKLEIGEGFLHLVYRDELERRFEVGEDVVSDEKEEGDDRV